MFCTTTTSIFRSHSEFRSRLKRKAISGKWQTFSPGQVPQRQSGIYALRLCPDFWQRADRGLYRPAFSGNVRHAGEFRKKRMVVTREDSQERDANPNRKGRQNVSIDRFVGSQEKDPEGKDVSLEKYRLIGIVEVFCKRSLYADFSSGIGVPDRDQKRPGRLERGDGRISPWDPESRIYRKNAVKLRRIGRR